MSNYCVNAEIVEAFLDMKERIYFKEGDRVALFPLLKGEQILFAPVDATNVIWVRVKERTQQLYYKDYDLRYSYYSTKIEFDPSKWDDSKYIKVNDFLCLKMIVKEQNWIGGTVPISKCEYKLAPCEICINAQVRSLDPLSLLVQNCLYEYLSLSYVSGIDYDEWKQLHSGATN